MPGLALHPAILVVADDPLQRKRLASLLGEGMEGTVLLANEGVETFEILASTPVDVVLVDFSPPYEIGLTLLCRLRRTHPSVRIVATVRTGGRGMLLDPWNCLQQARRLGADAALLDPFVAGELQGAVAGLLEETPWPFRRP